MVNEFISLSPKKQDDDGCYYHELSEKPLVSESSDEDTTSSSLMPIPDSLDIVRNELKNTINNFGGTNMDLDTKQPTEREMSIVNKITSANYLLDDLLSTNNIISKNLKDNNPLVFTVKTVPQRSSPPASEISGPTTNTRASSSEIECPRLPVASYAYPPTICKCPHPPEMKDQGTEPIHNSKLKKSGKCFLFKKIKCMRSRGKKKKPIVVDESQQTQPNYPSPNVVHGYTPNENQFHRITRSRQKEHHPKGTSVQSHRENKETCKFIYENVPEETEGEKNEDDEIPENLKKYEDDNENVDNIPTDQSTKTRIPLVPAQGRLRKGGERIDIYYFDHGNSSYYRTTDSHRAGFTEFILERTDEYATKFWAEVFGTITIAIAFVVSFILQFYRFVFTAIIRALTVGLIQIFSDYFFKPLLTVLFNGLIQPCLILGYNIATSTKDFCIPICEICEFCAKDMAIIFGSCRLVEVKSNEQKSPSCHCRHNV